MFKSLTENNVGRGGSAGRGDVKNSLGYANYPSKEKGHASQVAFLFGENILKKARFVLGDRLELLYDSGENIGLFRRIPLSSNGGVILSKATSGGYLKVHIRGSKEYPIIRHAVNLENVTVEDEGILFAWPKA